LLNVRLDDDIARLVRRLRDRGVSISTLVRDAIRAEAQHQVAQPFEPEAVLAEMRSRFPRPPGSPSSRRIDTADRRQAGRLIRGKLRRPAA
jgi:Ribbon-helix-helix protein, copG family